MNNMIELLISYSVFKLLKILLPEIMKIIYTHFPINYRIITLSFELHGDCKKIIINIQLIF